MPDYTAQTSNYDQPGFSYSGLTGITIGGVSVASIFVPIHLTQYNPTTYTGTLQTQPLIPNITGGFAYGGTFQTAQGRPFPKITLNGFIDNVLVQDTETGTYAGTEVWIPNVQVNSIPMHWVTVMKIFFDGRYTGARLDPDYYQDPYGRQYNVRLFDWTANYVPGSPQRANFTSTLMLNKSYA